KKRELGCLAMMAVSKKSWTWPAERVLWILGQARLCFSPRNSTVHLLSSGNGHEIICAKEELLQGELFCCPTVPHRDRSNCTGRRENSARSDRLRGGSWHCVSTGGFERPVANGVASERGRSAQPA